MVNSLNKIIYCKTMLLTQNMQKNPCIISRIFSMGRTMKQILKILIAYKNK